MIPRSVSLVACLVVVVGAATFGSSQNPWPRHVIDDSSRGADGIRLADVNGDGLPDITTGWEEGGTVRVYLNPGPGEAQTKPWREHALGGAGREVMFLELADLDRDGLEDVLVGAKPREILWLRRLDRSGRAWEPHSLQQPQNTGTAKAVNAADFDGDGKLDLVFSCEGAKPPLQGLMWLSCAGPLTTGNWVPHVLSGPDGIKHDLIGIVDLNGDGHPDVITTEESAGENRTGLGVIWYENACHR